MQYTATMAFRVLEIQNERRQRIVNLRREKSFWCEGVRCRKVALGRCHCLPDAEGSRTQKSTIPRF
jgi:hypothetical protein